MKKPKSMAERKRESRKRLKSAGLAEYRVVIPDNVESREIVRKVADQLQYKLKFGDLYGLEVKADALAAKSQRFQTKDADGLTKLAHELITEVEVLVQKKENLKQYYKKESV